MSHQHKQEETKNVSHYHWNWQAYLKKKKPNYIIILFSINIISKKVKDEVLKVNYTKKRKSNSWPYQTVKTNVRNVNFSTLSRPDEGESRPALRTEDVFLFYYFSIISEYYKLDISLCKNNIFIDCDHDFYIRKKNKTFFI